MLFRYPHLRDIAKRPRGTLEKCQEELEELTDAHQQRRAWHVAVEAADLINSTYTFVWRHYRIPFFVVILVALLTSLYKPTLRLLRKAFPARVRVLPPSVEIPNPLESDKTPKGESRPGKG